MNYAPIVRIILRYIVGAAFMGSTSIGEQLAADPDIVMAGAIALGAIIEATYAIAVRKGWTT